MIEALLQENPFNYVSKRELVQPLIDAFFTRTRSGLENSIFLSELTALDRHLMSEFSIACQDTINFAQLMAQGQLEPPPPKLLDLAKRAVQQCMARQNEDVQVWAERLARDVSEVTD
jgi:hypothetical protein